MGKLASEHRIHLVVAWQITENFTGWLPKYFSGIFTFPKSNEILIKTTPFSCFFDFSSSFYRKGSENID